MDPANGRVLVVGAGHAGGSCAAFLRQFGFSGPITVVGEDPLAPYQRPPLSKAWLKGEADSESLKLRPDSFYEENGVELRLGQRVDSIDRAARTARLNGVEILLWDALVLATGSEARKLTIPGADDPAVLELRTAADADRLKAMLTPGARLVVIGAGYVGLEAAASARALGCSVSVIERESRVLARVASPALSAFYEAKHRAEGVEILTAAFVVAIERGRRVILADGGSVEGDAVLVGVGASPCESLALAAGLDCLSGVLTDAWGRTSDPAIFAIGDAARRPVELCGGERLRLESVPNALETARRAAAALTGRDLPAPEVPWFWSDQYDVKLQIAGVLDPDCELVVRGDPAAGRFAVFGLDMGPGSGGAGAVRFVEAVNAPAEFMAGRLLIARGSEIDRGRLADSATPAKALLAG